MVGCHLRKTRKAVLYGDTHGGARDPATRPLSGAVPNRNGTTPRPKPVPKAKAGKKADDTAAGQAKAKWEGAKKTLQADSPALKRLHDKWQTALEAEKGSADKAKQPEATKLVKELQVRLDLLKELHEEDPTAVDQEELDKAGKELAGAKKAGGGRLLCETLRATEIKHAKQKKAVQAALDKAEASRNELDALKARIQAEDEDAADQQDILEELDGQLEKDRTAVAGEGAHLGSAQVDAMAEGLAEMQQAAALAMVAGTAAGHMDPEVRTSFENFLTVFTRLHKIVPPELRLPAADTQSAAGTDGAAAVEGGGKRQKGGNGKAVPPSHADNPADKGKGKSPGKGAAPVTGGIFATTANASTGAYGEAMQQGALAVLDTGTAASDNAMGPEQLCVDDA